MTSRIRAALIVTLIAAWLGGCGGEQQGAPATTAAPVRPAGLKIVMIAKSTTNPIFVSARKGAEAAARELAEKHGIRIEIVWMTPDREDGQAPGVGRLAGREGSRERHPDFLFRPRTTTSAIDNAVDRGVPVMTFDSERPTRSASRSTAWTMRSSGRL